MVPTILIFLIQNWRKNYFLRSLMYDDIQWQQDDRHWKFITTSFNHFIWKWGKTVTVFRYSINTKPHLELAQFTKSQKHRAVKPLYNNVPIIWRNNNIESYNILTTMNINQ
jgi:hypothetical protein